MRRYAAIRRDPETRLGSGALCVFVADHGVAEDGVSAYPQAVTAEMLRNIAGAAARRSACSRGASVIGCGSPTLAWRPIPAPTRCPGSSTGVSEPRARAIWRARPRCPSHRCAPHWRLAWKSRAAVAAGATLIGIGEMGIGNSTSAAALLAAFTQIPPARLAGRGTGVDDTGMRRKVAVIERALKLHRAALKDPLRHARGAGRLRDRRDGRRMPGRRSTERAGGG